MLRAQIVGVLYARTALRPARGHGLAAVIAKDETAQGEIEVDVLAGRGFCPFKQPFLNALERGDAGQPLVLAGAAAIRAARQRGEETGLTGEEIAFYDALAANASARDMMGEPALRLIAHELMQTIKTNVTVDWVHRDSARANIRRLVKRILRKYGYPPDLQDIAVQNVLQQAEAMSSQFADS